MIRFQILCCQLFTTVCSSVLCLYLSNMWPQSLGITGKAISKTAVRSFVVALYCLVQSRVDPAALHS